MDGGPTLIHLHPIQLLHWPKPAAKSILSFVLSGDEVFEDEAWGTVVPPLEPVVEEAAEVTVVLLVLDIKALEAVVEEGEAVVLLSIEVARGVAAMIEVLVATL